MAVGVSPHIPLICFAAALRASFPFNVAAPKILPFSSADIPPPFLINQAYWSIGSNRLSRSSPGNRLSVTISPSSQGHCISTFKPRMR